MIHRTAAWRWFKATSLGEECTGIIILKYGLINLWENQGHHSAMLKMVVAS